MALLGDQLKGYWALDELNGTRTPVFGGGNFVQAGSQDVGSVADGIIGRAAAFPFSVDHWLQLPFVEAAAAECVVGNFDFTWNFWMRLNANNVVMNILGHSGGNPDLRGLSFVLLSNGQLRVTVSEDGTASTNRTVDNTAFGTIAINTWVMCTARYNAATNIVTNTVNATSSNTIGAAAVNDTTAFVRIGAASAPFDGEIDAFAIWKRHLSNDELIAVYNAGAARRPNSQGVFVLDEIISVIDPAGAGDYLDLQAWNDAEILAGTQTHLFQLNASHTALCRAGDVGPVTLSTGWVADDDRFVRIKADPAARHAGKFTITDVAYIDARGAGMHGFVAGLKTFRVEDMVVLQDDTTARVVSLAPGPTPGIIRLDHVVCKGGLAVVADISNTAVRFILRNVIAHGYSNGAVVFFGDVEIYQSTLKTIGAAIHITGNVVADEQNNYFANDGGALYIAGTGTINKGANTMTANSEALTIENRGIAHSTANFVNVSPDEEDYHLTPTSALVNQGADLSGEGVVDDIDGMARPQNGAYDVGADELLLVLEPEILEVQLVDLAGLVAVYVAAVVNCHAIENDGNTWVEVRNNSAAPISVTVGSTDPCDQEFDHDVVVVVPAGARSLIGTFPVPRFTGVIVVCYSLVANVEVAALRIERDC